MKSYPIYRDFIQRDIIGWVELNSDEVFTPMDIFSPEIAVDYQDPINKIKKDLTILSFGLINGKFYPKEGEAKNKAELEKIKNKNANK